MSAPAKASSRWLFGPSPDLLLGCGVGYAALFLLMCAYGSRVRPETASLIPFLTLIFGAPHYGATLLRVYARREDRRAYALFAVYATALLAAAFVAATRSAQLGSLLLTVYLTWSPWHYTGQNYGLAVMFLRRRGIALGPALKRCIYASFVLSYALTFTAMHQVDPTSYAPSIYTGYHMLALGIPHAVASVAILVLVLGYALTLAVAAALLLRRATPRDLAPTALLALTQALWFSIPVVARSWGVLQGVEPFASQYSTYYFFWAAIGHSVQYVWVASYYARSASDFAGLGRYFWKALLAGAAIWTIPPLLFAPHLLGQIPFDAGLGALVASVVNIHHFVLDGAIWKLRDGRIARVLIRSEPLPTSAAPIKAAPRLGWLAALGWGVGAASLGIVLFAQYAQEIGHRAWESGDAERMRLASRRLHWIGRESANVELQLGRLLASRGDARAALLSYRESIEIQPTADAWVALGALFQDAGKLDRAEDALAHAVELAPEQADVAYRAGALALERGDAARAQVLLARAVSLDPDKKLYRVMLDRARAGASD